MQQERQRSTFASIVSGDYESLLSASDLGLFLPWIVRKALSDKECGFLLDLVHQHREVAEVIAFFQATKEDLAFEKDFDSFEVLSSQDQIRLVYRDLGVLVKQRQENALLIPDYFLATAFAETLYNMIPIVVNLYPSSALPEIIQTIRVLPHGALLLQSVVRNLPHLFKKIAAILTTVDSTIPFDSAVNTLQASIAVDPLLGSLVRTILSRQQINVDVIVHATLAIGDEVDYFTSMLNAAWFWEKLPKAHENPQLVTGIRKCLTNHLNLMIQNQTESPNYARIVMIYCALTGFSGYNPNAEEMEKLMSALSLNTTNERSASVSLCFIFGCPGLARQVGKECIERKLNELFKSPYGRDVCLYIFTYCFIATNVNISDMIRQVLGLPISIHNDSVAKVKEVVTTGNFSESEIVSMLATLPITGQRFASQRDVAIISMYEIAKIGLFRKVRVDIKQWIYSMISSAKAPLHPLVSSLIEEYVMGILNVKGNLGHAFSPITEQEVESCLSSSTLGLPVKALMVYYLLFYVATFKKLSSEDKARFAGAKLTKGQSSGSSRYLKEYSHEFIQGLGIKAIFQRLESAKAQYPYIFPPLYGLYVTVFPEHSNIQQQVIGEDISRIQAQQGNRNASISFLSGLRYHHQSSLDSVTPEYFSKLMENINQLSNRVVDVLITLSQYPLKQLSKFHEHIATHLFRAILSEYKTIDRRIILLSTELWFKLYASDPQQSVTLTANVFCSNQSPILYSALVQDPIIILKAHDVVTTEPLIFSIVLEILTHLRAAFRNLPSSRQTLAGVTVASPYARTYESVIVQLLLEICLEKPAAADPGAFDEVRAMICKTLHQIFLDNTDLLKLIHFQGYPQQLLPMTVKGIPSMHICLEFLPELLSNQHHDRQLFGILLGSHIIEKYPLERSLSVARSILAIAKQTEGRPVADSLLVIESLPRIASAFPELCEPICELLLEYATPTLHSSEVVDASRDAFKSILNRVLLKNSREITAS